MLIYSCDQPSLEVRAWGKPKYGLADLEHTQKTYHFDPECGQDLTYEHVHYTLKTVQCQGVTLAKMSHSWDMTVPRFKKKTVPGWHNSQAN